MRTAIMALASLLLAARAVSVSADVIHVPADQPTIQAAIKAAIDGDEVVIAPGTYNEAIDFSGKAITVRGEAGPDATISPSLPMLSIQAWLSFSRVKAQAQCSETSPLQEAQAPTIKPGVC